MLFLIFSILIVYPVTLFPSFKILENNLFKSVAPETFKRTCLENILRTVIVIITIVIGILSINRFDTVLALAGCAIMTPIAFIFPSFFHYRLYRKTQSTCRNILDLSITIFGILMSLTILVFTLI